MVLTSFERLKRLLCVSDNPKNRASLTSYMYAVSNSIQAYINNNLELSQKVEYFDIFSDEIQFWLKATPIVSIDLVEHDYEGLFSGGETTLTDYHIGSDSKSVVLDFQELPGKRVLRVTYTGGVATSPTISTFAISGVSGTFLVNKFARGTLSGAVGIINSYTASSEIKIDNLYGVFQVGEPIAMQTTEGGTDVPGVSTTIDSITNQSLAEKLPEIALACELQVRYGVDVKENFEVTTIKKDETSRRDSQTELTFRGAYQDLQPEVRSLLNGHRRIVLS